MMGWMLLFKTYNNNRGIELLEVSDIFEKRYLKMLGQSSCSLFLRKTFSSLPLLKKLIFVYLLSSSVMWIVKFSILKCTMSVYSSFITTNVKNIMSVRNQKHTIGAYFAPELTEV